MTAINIMLAVLGSGITLMVVVGMIFLTPGGAEDHLETPDPPPATSHPEPAGIQDGRVTVP